MENDSEALITIEVIYALPNEQELITLRLSADCSVEEAIYQSKVLSRYPEIDLNINKIGIFGKTCQLTDSLYHNDRIEIYRPLVADPKEARKNRAKK
jgi:putative ubiquitin-RnfH superfamily antitoxin RatB of RatAB toxin-antitoxin module